MIPASPVRQSVPAPVLGAKTAAGYGLWSDDQAPGSAEQGDVGRIDDEGEGPEGGHVGLPGRAVGARARHEPFDPATDTIAAREVARGEDDWRQAPMQLSLLPTSEPNRPT